MKKYSEKSLFSILRTLGIGCALSIATSCSNNINEKNSYDNVSGPKKHNSGSNKRQQDKKNSSGGSKSQGQSLPKTKPKKQQSTKKQPVTNETQSVGETCNKGCSSKDIQTVEKVPEKDFYFYDPQYRENEVNEENIDAIDVVSWFNFWEKIRKTYEGDRLKNYIVPISFNLKYKDFCTLDVGIDFFMEEVKEFLEKTKMTFDTSTFALSFANWHSFYEYKYKQFDKGVLKEKSDRVKLRLYFQDVFLLFFVKNSIPKALEEREYYRFCEIDASKNEKIHDLMRINDELNTINGEISSSINSLTKKLNSLKKKNKDLTDELKTYQQMKDKEQSYQNTNDPKDKLKIQEEQNQILKAKLKQKSSDNIDLQRKLTFANIKLTELQEKYKKLEEDKERELEELGRKKDIECTNKYKGIWNEFISRGEKIDAQNKTINAQKETINVQKSEIETLANKKEELKRKIGSLQKEKGKMGRKIGFLRNKKGEMGEKIGYLQSEKEEFKRTIESLQMELKRIQQRDRMSLFDSIDLPVIPFLSNLEVQIPFRQNNLFAYNDMIISNNRFSRGMIEHESGELNNNEEAYVGSIRRNTLSTSNDMRNNIFVKGSRNRINNVSQKANPEEKSHIEHVSDSNSKNENSPSLSLFSSDSPNSFGDDNKK